MTILLLNYNVFDRYTDEIYEKRNIRMILVKIICLGAFLHF